MYKLVAIGGKLRGKEFILSEGENTIGRDSSCKFQVPLDGISKSHVKLTLSGETVYLEDLGSSNGTFVNNKITKKITLRDKDRITLPSIIFQLVYVLEKKIIIKKKIVKNSDKHEDDSHEEVPPPPVSLAGKIIYSFKYKLMPIIYKFNEEYEWRSMLVTFIVIFIGVTISLTIFPVLIDSKRILLTEVGARGFHYADLIARLNAVHLSRKNLDNIDTKFLETEPGIESYELFDIDGRIVRPLGKLNDSINDPFSIEAKEVALKGVENYSKNIGSGKYGISKPIKAYNVKTGVEELVGIIAIKFAPTSLVMEAANNSKAYLESFVTSAIVGIFFFAIIYFMTIKHFENIRFQVDQVVRGKQKEVSQKFLLMEFKPLISTLNTVLQKYLESQNLGSENAGGEIEEDGKYVNILKEFLGGANGAAMVLNSEKNIQAINLSCEDLTGIRESAGIGMSLLDVARDQGFAATVIDLCDQSANNGCVGQRGNYDLQGNAHIIHVVSLMGKDNFAKAFYITFIKE